MAFRTCSAVTFLGRKPWRGFALTGGTFVYGFALTGGAFVYGLSAPMFTTEKKTEDEERRRGKSRRRWRQARRVHRLPQHKGHEKVDAQRRSRGQGCDARPRTTDKHAGFTDASPHSPALLRLPTQPWTTFRQTGAVQYVELILNMAVEADHASAQRCGRPVRHIPHSPTSSN